jgi:hypothetical protein
VRSGSPHQDGTVPQIGTALECVRVVKSRGVCWSPGFGKADRLLAMFWLQPRIRCGYLAASPSFFHSSLLMSVERAIDSLVQPSIVRTNCLMGLDKLW